MSFPYKKNLHNKKILVQESWDVFFPMAGWKTYGFPNRDCFFFLRNKRSADHPSLRGIRKLWLVFSWLYIPLKKMCKGKKQLQTNQVYSKYHRKKKNKVKGEIHKAKDELVNWDVYSEKLPWDLKHANHEHAHRELLKLNTGNISTNRSPKLPWEHHVLSTLKGLICMFQYLKPPNMKRRGTSKPFKCWCWCFKRFANLSSGASKHNVKKPVIIEISYPFNCLYPNSFIRNNINIPKSPANNLVLSSIAKALPIFGKIICEEKRLMFLLFFCPNKGGRKAKVCLSTTKSYHRSWFRWWCKIIQCQIKGWNHAVHQGMLNSGNCNQPKPT